MKGRQLCSSKRASRQASRVLRMRTSKGPSRGNRHTRRGTRFHKQFEALARPPKAKEPRRVARVRALLVSIKARVVQVEVPFPAGRCDLVIQFNDMSAARRMGCPCNKAVVEIKCPNCSLELFEKAIAEKKPNSRKHILESGKYQARDGARFICGNRNASFVLISCMDGHSKLLKC